MSTKKILKSAKPHQVQMREGSKDAQRKPAKAKTEMAPIEAPAQRAVKVSASTSTAKAQVKVPVKTPVKVATRTPVASAVKASAKAPVKAARKSAKSVSTPVVVPASIAKKSRATPQLKAQEAPVAVDSSSKPTVTVPSPVPRAPVPEHELWESDSPVMRRISLLRTRNAQLSEQVQRLKKPA